MVGATGPSSQKRGTAEAQDARRRGQAQGSVSPREAHCPSALATSGMLARNTIPGLLTNPTEPERQGSRVGNLDTSQVYKLSFARLRQR